MPSQLSRTLLYAAVIAVCACSGGGVTDLGVQGQVDNTVASIVISPSSVPPITVGGTTTLTAVAKNALGTDVTSANAITWSSDNAGVATVAGGVVTAVGVGTANIAAASAGILSAVVVTVVSAAPVAVSTVTVSLASSSIQVASTTQATAVLKDAAGNALTGRTVTWTSASTGVATITAGGVITAVAAGTSTITATAATIPGSGTNVTGTAVVTVSAATSSGETLATLPQVFLNTAAPPAPDVGGRTISPTTAAAFQAALDTSLYGDVILLANNTTYVGNFILKPKTGASNGKWVTIRPVDVSQMPAQGARITPTIAALVKLPSIQSPNTAGAIATALGAHHFRFTGIEVTMTPTNTSTNTGLVRFGDGGGGGQTTVASIAHDFVIDRCWIHGGPSLLLRRAIGLNSSYTAIIDSYISDVHEARNSDAQAIAGWNGPGPFKIVNNYLEASTENVSFGGSDPDIANQISSDIEVRHNHLFKPVAWKTTYLVKNLFETKSAQRVLVEGNLMENNWLDGQGGSAINLKSTNQSGACPGCSSQDITFRYNMIRNTGAGFVLSANPDPNTVNFKLQRITITDNVITNINVAPTFDGDGRGVLINQDPIDITLAHNTILSPTDAAVLWGGPLGTPTVRMSIRDNIIAGGLYGVKSPGLAVGTASITAFMSTAKFLDNVIIYNSATGFPASNFYPTALSAVGFTSAATENYQLTASSAYKGKASDGKDVGADITALNAAIANVVVP